MSKEISSWDPSLSEDQFDAVLIYSNSDCDKDLAVKVQRFFQEQVPPLADGRRPRVCVFDSFDLLYITDRFQQLEEAVKRSTYMFVLLTECFVRDAWCDMAKNACLEEVINNREKKWCLIPIYEFSKKDVNFEIPMFLRSLKGLNLNEMFRDRTTDFRAIEIEDVQPTQLENREIKKIQIIFNSRIKYRQIREAKQNELKTSLEIKEYKRNHLAGISHDVVARRQIEHEYSEGPESNALFVTMPTDADMQNPTVPYPSIEALAMCQSRPYGNRDMIMQSHDTRFVDQNMTPKYRIPFDNNIVPNMAHNILPQYRLTAEGTTLPTYSKPTGVPTPLRLNTGQEVVYKHPQAVALPPDYAMRPTAMGSNTGPRSDNLRFPSGPQSDISTDVAAAKRMSLSPSVVPSDGALNFPPTQSSQFNTLTSTDVNSQGQVPPGAQHGQYTMQSHTIFQPPAGSMQTFSQMDLEMIARNLHQMQLQTNMQSNDPLPQIENQRTRLTHQESVTRPQLNVQTDTQSGKIGTPIQETPTSEHDGPRRNMSFDSRSTARPTAGLRGAAIEHSEIEEPLNNQVSDSYNANPSLSLRLSSTDTVPKTPSPSVTLSSSETSPPVDVSSSDTSPPVNRPSSETSPPVNQSSSETSPSGDRPTSDTMLKTPNPTHSTVDGSDAIGGAKPQADRLSVTHNYSYSYGGKQSRKTASSNAPRPASGTCYHRGPKTLSEEEMSSIIVDNNENLIGQGGFSKVFKGRWLDKDVAVKQIENLQAGSELHLIHNQFCKEKAVSFLRHPYILPVLAISDNQPVPSMFLFPYKEGGDLSKVLKNPSSLPRNCQSWKDFFRMAHQISQGLKYMHRPMKQRGSIRHGDIKPANILLDEYGNACIGDAGLAVEMPRDRCDITATNTNSGTYHFIDPDILRNKTKTTKNDVFSFGVVLMQMLTLSTGDSYQVLTQELQTSGGLTKQNISENIAHCQWNLWHEAEPEIKDRLIELALKCMHPLQNRISIDDVCVDFENMFEKFSNLGLQKHVHGSNNTPLCSMCHFYDSANTQCCSCEEPRFCSGCLSYSVINPLVCASCGPCRPVIGGEQVFALLIAGGGTGEEVFINDVRKVHNCLSDPRVIGIRKENIVCMFQKANYCKDETFRSNSKNVLTKLDEIGAKMQNCESSRLFLYVSCHSRTDNGHLVWSLQDKLYCDKVKDKLVTLKARLILTIVDCCFANAEALLPFGDCKNSHQSFIQWSSCLAEQKSKYNPKSGDNYGSDFTNCILKGLTICRTSKCPYDGKMADDCRLCRDFRASVSHHQCVMFGELHEFVKKHIEKKRTSQTPRVAFDGDSLQVKLAYYSSEPRSAKIWFRREDGQKELITLQHTLAEIKYFERLQKFICKKLIDSKQVENSVSVTELAKRLCITYINYKGMEEELRTFEDIERLYDRFELLECHLKN